MWDVSKARLLRAKFSRVTDYRGAESAGDHAGENAVLNRLKY
jgi:hypothetical protein